MEERPRLRIWIGGQPPPPNGLGGNDPSPDAPADEINDSISRGSSESAPPDFNGTFGAFNPDNRAIIRDQQAIEALLRQSLELGFPPVAGYSPFDDPEADRGLLDYYGHRFIDVRSPDKRRVREREIRRQEQNAELVHSSGWMGTFASIATGTPTPATWLPGGLVYQDGKETYVPGRVVPSSAVWPSPDNAALPAPSAAPDAPRRADAPAPQAGPSLDDTGGLGTPPTPEQAAPPPDPVGISLWDRMQLNGKDAYYRNTALGSAELALFSVVRRRIETGASDDALIAEFYPALLANRPNQKGYRAAALKWLHSAPQRHKAILADLTLYDAMKGFESAAEGIVAAGGQIVGSALSPESWVGAGIKGATWGARLVKGGLQQAGVSVAVDPLVQLQSMAAGAQEKFDGWRTAQSGLIGAVLGSGAGAWFGTSTKPKPGELPAKETPLGVRGEEPTPASVASEGEAQAPEVSSKTSGEKEPAIVSPEAPATKPTIDLAKHENGKEYHTLGKHSGKSVDYLQNRLDSKRKMKVASTFHDKAEADTSVQKLLDRRADKIEPWLSDFESQNEKYFDLMISEIGPDHPPIGLVLERGASAPKPGNGVGIWLRKDATMPEGFRVITAFVLP